MREERRRFEAVAGDGRKFTVLEFATFRWERAATGERRPIENAVTYLETDGGVAVVRDEMKWSYYIPQFGVCVRELDESKTSPAFPETIIEEHFSRPFASFDG